MRIWRLSIEWGPAERRIPDPGEDFEGCINAIADDVGGYMTRLLPDGLPALERARRRLAMSGSRYVRLVEMNAPWTLIENERRLLDKSVEHYRAEDEEASVRLFRVIMGAEKCPDCDGCKEQGAEERHADS